MPPISHWVVVWELWDRNGKPGLDGYVVVWAGGADGQAEGVKIAHQMASATAANCGAPRVSVKTHNDGAIEYTVPATADYRFRSVYVVRPVRNLE